jgi:hypothetical protein
MSKFNLGASVWLASFGNKQVQKTCIVCAGKKTVELILGTGEHVILPCDYCGKGWDGPRGFTMEYEFSAGAEELTIRQVDTKKTENGEISEYHFYDSRFAKEEDVFATQEEALAKAEERCVQHEIEERTRAEYIKNNQAKSYSWNAGYWLREAKRMEENAIRYRERVILCKAKSKVEEVTK